jgi:hypothetical protein
MGFLSVQVGSFDLVLTADHGVIPIPESKAGKAMNAKRVLEDDLEAASEKALQRLHPAPAEKWVLGLATPHLFLNKPLAERVGLDWPTFLRRAAEAVRKLDGVAEVYVPGEWIADPYADVYRRSFFPGRAGDLMVRQAEGVLMAYDAKETSHGAPYPYDSHVPLILWGPSFKTGLFAKPARVVDLAPTLGRLLGLDFPAAEGARVLTESLKAAP